MHTQAYYAHVTTHYESYYLCKGPVQREVKFTVPPSSAYTPSSAYNALLTALHTLFQETTLLFP